MPSAAANSLLRRGVYLGGLASLVWSGGLMVGLAVRHLVSYSTLWLPRDRADAHSLPCACRPLTQQGTLYVPPWELSAH